jgi:hypothetical protein
MSFGYYKCNGDQNIKFGRQLLVGTISNRNFLVAHFWSPKLVTKVFWFAWKKLGATWNFLVVQSRVAIDLMVEKKIGHCPNFVGHYSTNLVA